MSSPSYETASSYLNNLLLARGLLTDGKPIPFTKIAVVPSKDDSDDNSKEDAARTVTGRIINLIHDLVLRRDRDAEQKEALTGTIRSLRTEEHQRLLDLQKLQDKNAALKGQIQTAEGQHRLLRQDIKKCQAETRHYLDQNIKLKSTLDQVRAKCISDIRARDNELNKLKNHLTGLNRGARGGFDPSRTRLNTLKTDGSAKITSSAAGAVEGDSVFAQESPEILTALLNETSTENVALRKIIGDSMSYLKSLTDMESAHTTKPVDEIDEFGTAIGIPGQYRNLHLPQSPDLNEDNLTSVATLAASMSSTLQHCQTILKDPSFVPIEEVQIRDEEIKKLKTGWERMADRWREAVSMMGSWRREMLETRGHAPAIPDLEHSGEHIQDHYEEEEDQMSIFRRSVATRPDGRPVLDPIEEEEFTSMLQEHQSRLAERSMLSNQEQELSQQEIEEDTLQEPDSTGTPRATSSTHSHSSIFDHEDSQEPVESSLDLQPVLKTIQSPARRGITLPSPGRHPLSSTSGNARKRKSPASSTTSSKRRSVAYGHDSTYMSDEHEHNSAAPDILSALSTSTTDPSTPQLSDDSEAENIEEPSTTKSSEKLSIAEKLAAVQAQAQAAETNTQTVTLSIKNNESTEVIRMKQALVPDERRARDRKSGETRERKLKSTALATNKAAVGTKKTAKTNPPRVTGDGSRKEKIRNRRRSTLTPAELGELMR